MNPITLKINVTLDEEVLAEIIQRAVIKAGELQRETRFSVSQHPSLRVEKPQDVKGFLIDTKQAAKLLAVSPRTVWQMENDGQMPAAIRIGGRAVRWGYEELQAWVNAGCPRRSEWTWPR